VEVALATRQLPHVTLWFRPDPKPEAKSAVLRQFGHNERARYLALIQQSAWMVNSPNFAAVDAFQKATNLSPIR
jgi:hypothetical protein